MGGIVDSLSSSVGIGPIFGNADQAGLMGTGQYMGGVYQGNKDAFYSNPNYDADRKQMQQAYDVMANREAPTASAAQMNDPSIKNAQGAAQTMQQSNVGQAFDRAAAQSNNYAQMNAAQIQGGNTNQAATQLGWGGPTGINANAQAAKIGQMQNAQAAQAQGATIDQSQQAQFRNQQGQLANMQMQAAQGQGPSIAGMQLQAGLGANLQQQMAAAQSQRGGANAGTAQRQLANNAAAANMGTQQQAAQMKVGETLAARQQLADLSANARSQDIGLAQNQAQLAQQAGQFNAANQQQVGLANQGYQNQATMQQAAMQQQMQLANQQAQNTGALTQAQLSAQQTLANQQYQNQFAGQNAAMQQQAGMFNAGNQQQMYQQNLANQQQSNLANQQAQMQATGANQQAGNQMGMAQFGANQQTGLANQQSQLQTNQMNNQAGINILGMQTQGDLQQQQNQMAYEQMMAQQYAGLSQTNAAAYNNAQGSKSGIMGMLGGFLGGMSDEDEKKNVNPMDSETINEVMGNSKDGTSNTWADIGKMLKAKNDYTNAYKQQGQNGQTSSDSSSSKNFENYGKIGGALASYMGSGAAAGAGGGAAGGLGGLGGGAGLLAMSDEREKIPARKEQPQQISGAQPQQFTGQWPPPPPQMGNPYSPGLNMSDEREKVSSTPTGPGPQGGIRGGGSSSTGGSWSGADIGKAISSVAGEGKGGEELKPGEVHHIETDSTSSGAGSSQDIMKTSSTGGKYWEPSAQPQPYEYIKPGKKKDDGWLGGEGIFGDLFGGVFSDENEKKQITSGDANLKEFIDNVHPHEFNYKHPEIPGEDAKTHYSPMAQELEKSKIGKSMVYDTPNGKMVDFGRGLGAMLAIQAQMNERLNKIEGGKKGKK